MFFDHVNNTFDIRQYRYIVWEDEESLKKEIAYAIEGLGLGDKAPE